MKIPGAAINACLKIPLMSVRRRQRRLSVLQVSKQEWEWTTRMSRDIFRLEGGRGGSSTATVLQLACRSLRELVSGALYCGSCDDAISQ